MPPLYPACARLASKHQATYSIQQEQLRANMQALNCTGDEAAFHRRIVGQLRESQDWLDEIAAKSAALKQ